MPVVFDYKNNVIHCNGHNMLEVYKAAERTGWYREAKWIEDLLQQMIRNIQDDNRELC